ncbi:hypothetical protein V8F33_000649 [Rhypophila sp. PSN 637]
MPRYDYGHNGHFESTDKTAIRGNFIPISKSLKGRSPSPQRHQHIPHVVQLSLTESQMDRLTSVLSSDGEVPPSRGRPIPQSTSSHQIVRENIPNRSPVRRNTEGKEKPLPVSPPARERSRSPVKFWQNNKKPADTPPRQRSRSPAKFWSNSKSQNSRHVAYDLDNTPQSPSRQPAHRQVIENLPSAMVSSPSAFRREEHDILIKNDTGSYDQYASPSPTRLRRRSREPNLAQPPTSPTVISPASPKFVPVAEPSPSFVSDSVYSGEDEFEFDTTGISVDPLRVNKNEARKGEVLKHDSVLKDYAEWMNSPCVPESEGSNLDRLQAARGSDRAPTNNQSSLSSGTEPQFSALSPFTAGLPGGPTRIASKTLIGQNGWLESTTTVDKPLPEKKQGFFDNLMRKAKGMVDKGPETQTQRRSRESDKSQPGNSRALAVSLNPREQSLLYCELEYTLATAMNDYITAEFDAGRLETDKLKKISEGWQQRGRPKVKGFRYDLETQLELVKLHVNHFKFYGTTVQPMAILGVLDMMTVNARSLRIRTFCQPDTVIAKQLLDSQNLFNTIGTPEHQHIQLAEITHFFRAAIERERLYSQRARQNAQLRRSKSTQASKDNYQHQSSSTQNRSNGQHQSYATQTSKSLSHKTQHNSHGTQRTRDTQNSQQQSSHHHNHGTQGSKGQRYGTNRQLHRSRSRVRNESMDPAAHDSDEGF